MSEEAVQEPTEPTVVETPEGDTPEPTTPETPNPAPETPESDEGADPNPESDPEQDQEPDASEDLGYEEYSDPVLKQAVNVLKKANISAEESNALFAEVLETGDFSKLDKAALVEKLGEGDAELVTVLAEKYFEGQRATFERLENDVYDLTGGKEVFESMRDWAQTKAESDPEFAKDLAEIRDMLNTGNTRIVKAAVTELFDMYKVDPDTTIPAELLKGDKPGSNSGVIALSRAEYIDAVEKAHRNGTYEQDAPKLWAQRELGKKKGI